MLTKNKVCSCSNHTLLLQNPTDQNIISQDQKKSSVSTRKCETVFYLMNWRGDMLKVFCFISQQYHFNFPCHRNGTVQNCVDIPHSLALSNYFLLLIVSFILSCSTAAGFAQSTVHCKLNKYTMVLRTVSQSTKQP